jgi:hypothetical protein
LNRSSQPTTVVLFARKIPIFIDVPLSHAIALKGRKMMNEKLPW